MTDDNNGWAEHKKLVLSKLDEHGEEIKSLQGDVTEIKIAMTDVPQMAKNVEELVRHQAIVDGVAEATGNTGVHQLPVQPSVLKKVASNDWFKLMIMGLVMGAFSIGAFQCHTPGGYGCEAQDITKEASKTTP